MIVKKITTGFVVQDFDTELGKFIGQEFVAGDDCQYEDALGNPVDPQLLEVDGKEVYLLFTMTNENRTLEQIRIRVSDLGTLLAEVEMSQNPLVNTLYRRLWAIRDFVGY